MSGLTKWLSASPSVRQSGGYSVRRSVSLSVTQFSWEQVDVRTDFSPSCCSTSQFQLAFGVFDACTVNFFASVVFPVRSIFPFHTSAIKEVGLEVSSAQVRIVVVVVVLGEGVTMI